jgi:hypothetical protein
MASAEAAAAADCARSARQHLRSYAALALPYYDVDHKKVLIMRAIAAVRKGMHPCILTPPAAAADEQHLTLMR